MVFVCFYEEKRKTMWNVNFMQQGNFIDVFLARHVSGASSGALDVELQHMVCCTEFFDGWWSWEPLRRSCLRCGWCRAPSSGALDAELQPMVFCTEFLDGWWCWVEEFKYLGTTLTNQNSIPEETKSRLRSWNVCYHSVQNLLSSRLLSKNLKIKIYIEL